MHLTSRSFTFAVYGDSEPRPSYHVIISMPAAHSTMLVSGIGGDGHFAGLPDGPPSLGLDSVSPTDAEAAAAIHSSSSKFILQLVVRCSPLTIAVTIHSR